MRLIDSFRRSGRNLRRAKMRTILTMLSISVGAFALMVALASGAGARQFVERLVSSNFDDHSVYAFKVAEQGGGNLFANSDEAQEYSGPVANDAQVEPGRQLISKAEAQKIAGVEGVDHVVPLVHPKVEYITAHSANKKYVTEIKSIDEGVKYDLLAGSASPTLPEGQVILPETMLGPLGFATAEQAVGQQVTVQFTPGPAGPMQPMQYKVAAVAKKPSGLLGGAREVIFSQVTLESVFAQQVGPQNVNYAAVIAYAKNNDPESLAKIRAALLDLGFQSLSAEELAKQVTQAVNIVQYFVAGFGVIAIIVSIFGIVNTQLISVLERTRQIGLMKALGLSGRGVLTLFTFEAMWIGLGGSIIGIFFAYVAGIFLNPVIDRKLQLGGDLLIFSAAQVYTLILTLLVVAAVSGLLPAWKAARLNPIEALRTE